MAAVTGSGRPGGGGLSSVALGLHVLVGAFGVGLLWSGLNALLETGSLGPADAVATVCGLFLLVAVGASLWRSLSRLLPDTPPRRPRKEG